MTIHRQIIAFTTAVVMLALTILYIITSIIFNRQQKNAAFNYLSLASNIAVVLIDERLTEMSSGSSLILKSPDLRHAVLNQDIEILSDYLDVLTENYPFMDFALVLNAKGVTIADTPFLKDNSEDLFDEFIDAIVINHKGIATNYVLLLDDLFMEGAKELKEYSIQLPNTEKEVFNKALVNLVITPVQSETGDIGGYLVVGEIINRSTYYPEKYTNTISNSYLTITIGDIRVCTNISLIGQGEYLGTTIPVFDEYTSHGNQTYFGSDKNAPLGDNYYFLYKSIFDYKQEFLGYIGVGTPEQSFIKLLNTNRLIFIISFSQVCQS